MPPPLHPVPWCQSSSSLGGRQGPGISPLSQMGTWRTELSGDLAKASCVAEPGLEASASPWPLLECQGGLVDFRAECCAAHPLARSILFFTGDLGFAGIFLHPAPPVPLLMRPPCFASHPTHPTRKRPSGPEAATFPGDRYRSFLPWPRRGAVAPLRGCWEGGRHGHKAWLSFVC